MKYICVTGLYELTFVIYHQRYQHGLVWKIKGIYADKTESLISDFFYKLAKVVSDVIECKTTVPCTLFVYVTYSRVLLRVLYINYGQDMEYLEGAPETLEFKMLIRWKWLGTNHKIILI